MDVNGNNLADAASTPSSDCASRPFPVTLGNVNGRASGDFAVVVRQSAFNRLYAHAHSTTDVEVCGILLGEVCHDGRAPYLHITASIPGLHADSHAARVTFTSDTWTHFHEVRERDFPDQRIVGWYHTHPGFGIFLSGMDLFIHNNFFALPWQVAYVYDPLGGDEGFFVWQNGQATRAAALIEPDAAGAKPIIERRISRPIPEDEADGNGSDVSAAEQSPIKRLKQWFWRGVK